MKFGIAFANTGPFAQPAGAAQLALAAETSGFDSLWTVEHVVVPSGYESAYPYSPDGKMPGRDDAPIPDPLVWLAYLAGITSTIKLGTGILILPQRSPVILAKETATLDMLSNGRLELGIGVGWLAEEFAAIGVPFSQRGARTDDHVLAMRSLWSGQPVSHNSEFTQFTDCISQPRPVNGTVPIHVGGHTEAAARRAGRLGDGFFPAGGTPDELRHLVELARLTAVEHGREPASLEISTMGMPSVADAAEKVAALQAIGVDRMIVPAFAFYKDTETALATYGQQIVKEFG